MRLLSRFLLLAFLGAGTPALALGGHCGATSYPGNCCFPEQCGSPQISYRVCYRPIVEEKSEVCYRPVYRTVMRERRTTVCKPVYQPHAPEYHFTSYRQYWES